MNNKNGISGVNLPSCFMEMMEFLEEAITLPFIGYWVLIKDLSHVNLMPIIWQLLMSTLGSNNPQDPIKDKPEFIFHLHIYQNSLIIYII